MGGVWLGEVDGTKRAPRPVSGRLIVHLIRPFMRGLINTYIHTIFLTKKIFFFLNNIFFSPRRVQQSVSFRTRGFCRKKNTFIAADPKPAEHLIIDIFFPFPPRLPQRSTSHCSSTPVDLGVYARATCIGNDQHRRNAFITHKIISI